MTGLIVTLAALASPPPSPASAPPPISIQAAGRFAVPVADLVVKVRATYFRPVDLGSIALAAARGLYRTAGERLPATTEAAARKVTDKTELTAYLATVRVDLGLRPTLADPRDYLAAVSGLTDALDPYCELVLDSTGGSIGRSANEAVLGVEFAGLTNAWWVEQTVVPEGGSLRFSGVVGRVAPGGFAARNGIRPGDRILSVNGIPLEHPRFRDVGKQVSEAHSTYFSARIEDELRLPPRIPVTYERDGVSRSEKFLLDQDPSRIESVFGVQRTEKGEWSHLLPTLPGRPKFGFIRLGPLDYGTGARLGEALDQLMLDSAKGIILDLRDCPGGYVNEAALVADRFIPAGRIIYTAKTQSADSNANGPVKSTTGHPDSFGQTVPLVVLVDQTTQGGGELIAAALRDNQRGFVAGRRTFGKGLILSVVPTSYPGLSYRVSSGVCLRPNGTDRHRYPDSKPTDSWGIRPDPGWEFATSRDYAIRVNEWYDLHAIRTRKSTHALPLDDPLNDPVLQFAIRQLGEEAGKKGKKQ